MAQSKQMAICDAVAALLASVASGNVAQDRDYVLPTDKASQVHVNYSSSEPQEGMVYNVHPRDFATEIEVDVLARKSGSTQAAKVADALWVEIYGLVMANQTLGGLAIQLDPGGWDLVQDQADTSLCQLRGRFTVVHRTDNNSISS
jgi:hypothetical protein